MTKPITLAYYSALNEEYRLDYYPDRQGIDACLFCKLTRRPSGIKKEESLQVKVSETLMQKNLQHPHFNWYHFLITAGLLNGRNAKHPLKRILIVLETEMRLNNRLCAKLRVKESFKNVEADLENFANKNPQLEVLVYEYPSHLWILIGVKKTVGECLDQSVLIGIRDSLLELANLKLAQDMLQFKSELTRRMPLDFAVLSEEWEEATAKHSFSNPNIKGSQTLSDKHPAPFRFYEFFCFLLEGFPLETIPSWRD